MAGLQSFSAEICSLICQDPMLKRLDLNSICFISHAFRNEARRELSYRFPCLQGASEVKAWCLSLQFRPHIAKDVEGLVLLLPQPPALRKNLIERLRQALHMCVNLKELAVLFQERHLRRTGLQEPKYSSSTHILKGHPFKLTKFVNGYFCQDDIEIVEFLRSQPNLKSLELHPGKTNFNGFEYYLGHLKSLAGPPQFIYDNCHMPPRLRLDFGNSLDGCEIDLLGYEIKYQRREKTRSLAIYLKQKQSHFPEIIRAIAHMVTNSILHLEIHQFFPAQVKKYLPLPPNFANLQIQTLVFRPPPGLPKMAGDNPNHCAYVELRSPIGRRRVAKKLIMEILPTISRLVLIVHGENYEFRWNSSADDVTEETLITWDAGEWASVM